jgi:hypothetical protein
MINQTPRELLIEIRQQIKDPENQLAKKIDLVLSTKSNNETHIELALASKAHKQSKLDIEERKIAAREKALALREQTANAKADRVSNSMWPKPTSEEALAVQIKERQAFSLLITHYGVKRLRVETCLRSFRAGGIEFTLDDAKGWLGLE